MITAITTILLVLVTAADPQSVTMEEFFKQECNKGNQQACDDYKNLSASLVIQRRIKERSEIFWNDVNTSELMLDEKRPNLQAAYPLVIRDFIKTEQEAGENVEVNEERLPECAQHYHNHWINKKLWYPSNENGTPDWTAIYEYIVDHYYGYCLRQP